MCVYGQTVVRYYIVIPRGDGKRKSNKTVIMLYFYNVRITEIEVFHMSCDIFYGTLRTRLFRT